MSFLWDNPPRIVAHRGAPTRAPENTLASFRAALHAGARAIELDVRLTRDERVVVLHDAFLGRTVAGEGMVEELTLAQLQAFDAGGWFASEFQGERVPTLDEVLSALPRDVLLDVELKADALNAEALPMKVHELLRAHDALDRALVTSFAPELSDAYARYAGRPAGMILPFVPDAGDLEAWPRLPFVALAEDAAVEGGLELARKMGRRVLVWTVNDASSARALLQAGTEAIITDRPGPLRDRLAPGEGAAAP